MRAIPKIILWALLILAIGCQRPDEFLGSEAARFAIVDSIVLDHSDLGLVLWGPRLIERDGSHRFCLVDDNNVYTDYDLHSGKRLTTIDLKPWLLKAGVSQEERVCATIWLRPTVLAVFCLAEAGLIVIDVSSDQVSSVRLHPFNEDLGTFIPWVGPTSCEPTVVTSTDSVSTFIVGLQKYVGAMLDDDEWRRNRFSSAPYTIYRVDGELNVLPVREIGVYPQHYQSEVVRHAGTSLFCTDSTAILSFDTDSNVTEYRLSDGALIGSFVVPVKEKIINVPFDLENDDPRYFPEYYYTTTRAPWVKKLGHRMVRGVIPGNTLPADRVVSREYNEHDWKIVVMGDEQHSSRAVVLSGLEYHSNFFETLGNDIYLLRHNSGEERFTIVRGRLE